MASVFLMRPSFGVGVENNSANRAETDETITLPATAARLTGSSVRMNNTTKVAAWWKTPQDRATWRFEISKDGVFDVVLTWGAPKSIAGQPFHVEIDGKRILEKQVPATGGYAKFKRGH